MKNLENSFNPQNISDEQEVIDPIETFAEQLEKIDIATYLCHNCTLEEMQKMKQRVVKNKEKLKKLQKAAQVEEILNEEFALSDEHEEIILQ